MASRRGAARLVLAACCCLLAAAPRPADALHLRAVASDSGATRGWKVEAASFAGIAGSSMLGPLLRRSPIPSAMGGALPQDRLLLWPLRRRQGASVEALLADEVLVGALAMTPKGAGGTAAAMNAAAELVRRGRALAGIKARLRDVQSPAAGAGKAAAERPTPQQLASWLRSAHALVQDLLAAQQQQAHGQASTYAWLRRALVAVTLRCWERATASAALVSAGVWSPEVDRLAHQLLVQVS